MPKLVRFLHNEEGIQHAEEALLLALIAVVAAATVTTLGTKIDGVFNTVNGKLS
jgi:Flp pilus assembly pilin Flp